VFAWTQVAQAQARRETLGPADFEAVTDPVFSGCIFFEQRLMYITYQSLFFMQE